MAKGPVFQHRHYKAIAAELTDPHGDMDSATLQRIRIRFAYMFSFDNPRFDRARFIAAASGKPSNSRDKV